MGTSDLYLSIPNISEGRRLEVIERIAKASETSGARLLDVHSDRDHNRSVLTLAGTIDSLITSSLQMTKEAVASIDLQSHEGVHPRIGAVDVIPFTTVPGRSNDLGQAIEAATITARRIWEELAVPCFLYELAALKRHAEALSLPQIRRNAFELLAPDFGDAPHPTAGATTVGARNSLVAYNVFLETEDESLAKTIARRVRSSSGGLPGIRALGFYLTSRRQGQVSMNLIDPDTTGIGAAHDAVAKEAKSLGLKIAGAELVGTCARSALEGRVPESIGLTEPPKFLEDLLA